jgi:hypothetical protein
VSEAAQEWLPQAAQLRDELAREGAPAFGVVDGARAKGAAVMFAHLKIPHASLFRNSDDQDLERIGPYLVLPPLEHDPLTLFIASEGLLEATTFFITAAGPEAVRTHLRRYLKVLDSEGRRRFFRFYDPRVLTPFLGAATPLERARFFGPFTAILALDPAPETPARLLRRWQAPAGISVDRYPDINQPLRLTPEVEKALGEDMLDRYVARVIRYLRDEHPVQTSAMDDAALAAVLAKARQMGAELRLTAGRDISLLAEIALLGIEQPTRAELEKHPWYGRPKALSAWRDKAVLLLRERMLNTAAGATS